MAIAPRNNKNGFLCTQESPWKQLAGTVLFGSAAYFAPRKYAGHYQGIQGGNHEGPLVPKTIFLLP